MKFCQPLQCGRRKFRHLHSGPRDHVGRENACPPGGAQDGNVFGWGGALPDGQGPREIDQVGELGGGNDPRLCERPFYDARVGRQPCRVARPRLGSGLGLTGHDCNDRFFSRQIPTPLHQTIPIRDSFQVERDHAGLWVGGQIFENIDFIHVAGIAESGDLAHAVTVNFHHLVHQRRGIEACLADDPNRAFTKIWEIDERRGEPVRGIHQPAAVRAPEACAAAANDVQDRTLQTPTFGSRLGETRRRNHNGGNPSSHACRYRFGHRRCWEQDNCQVDRPGTLFDGRKARKPQDFLGVGVDRIDRPRKVAPEILDLLVARLSWCA